MKIWKLVLDTKHNLFEIFTKIFTPIFNTIVTALALMLQRDIRLAQNGYLLIGISKNTPRIAEHITDISMETHFRLLLTQPRRLAHHLRLKNSYTTHNALLHYLYSSILAFTFHPNPGYWMIYGQKAGQPCRFSSLHTSLSAKQTLCCDMECEAAIFLMVLSKSSVIYRVPQAKGCWSSTMCTERKERHREIDAVMK